MTYRSESEGAIHNTRAPHVLPHVINVHNFPTTSDFKIITFGSAVTASCQVFNKLFTARIVWVDVQPMNNLSNIHVWLSLFSSTIPNSVSKLLVSNNNTNNKIRLNHWRYYGWTYVTNTKVSNGSFCCVQKSRQLIQTVSLDSHRRPNGASWVGIPLKLPSYNCDSFNYGWNVLTKHTWN